LVVVAKNKAWILLQAWLEEDFSLRSIYYRCAKVAKKLIMLLF